MKKLCILLSTLFMFSACHAENTTVDKQLTAEQCSKYRFSFDDISAINIPKIVIDNRGKAIAGVNDLSITYNGKILNLEEVADACRGFSAEGNAVKNIPDNCAFLISAEQFWAKKPECAKTGKYKNITENCMFLCTKSKCFPMREVGYMLYVTEDNDFREAQFNEKTGEPYGFYNDDNPCGHKYWRP